ncbi:MAG: hypothetical protein MK137_07835 [Rickettsiales bacterium]|nr:hypothetical protein [Rickettsiales bacterium]
MSNNNEKDNDMPRRAGLNGREKVVYAAVTSRIEVGSKSYQDLDQKLQGRENELSR